MQLLPSSSLRRRDLLGGLAGLTAAALAPGVIRPARAAEPLTLWGIPASPSAVFPRAVTAPALQAAAPGVQVDVWKSTDQMRAGIASSKFELFATSTYSAANFYNRGGGTRMVNVITWGVLYVMARDESVTGIADLAGKSGGQGGAALEPPRGAGPSVPDGAEVVGARPGQRCRA